MTAPGWTETLASPAHRAEQPARAGDLGSTRPAGPAALRLALAFVRRDLRIAWSYRFSFVMQYAGMLFSLVGLKFTSSLFAGVAPAALREYGDDYFSFALIGLSLSLLAQPAIKSFAQGVRAAQTNGTFEAMLAGRAGPTGIILCSGIFGLLTTCLQVLLTVVVGAVAFGADLRLTNLGAMLLIMAMTLVTLTGIGLMSTAFVIVFKQAEPFTGAFLAASLMLSGIIYPTSVLPAWMERLAPLLPLTHSLALARALLIDGAGQESLAGHALALVAFCLLFPLGLALLSVALRTAKRTGSIGHY